MLIGALLDDSVVNNGGQAFLFDAATGVLVRSFRDPVPGVNDVFGVEVAIEGDTVVISATGDNTGATDAGQVSILDRDTGVVRRTLNNPAPGIADRFGNSLAISGNRMVVGELRDDTDGQDHGIAHVFDAMSGDRCALFATQVLPELSNSLELPWKSAATMSSSQLIRISAALTSMEG